MEHLVDALLDITRINADLKARLDAQVRQNYQLVEHIKARMYRVDPEIIREISTLRNRVAGLERENAALFDRLQPTDDAIREFRVRNTELHKRCLDLKRQIDKLSQPKPKIVYRSRLSLLPSEVLATRRVESMGIMTENDEQAEYVQCLLNSEVA